MTPRYAFHPGLLSRLRSCPAFLNRALLLLVTCLFGEILTGCTSHPPPTLVSKWSRFNYTLQSTVDYTNAIQQAHLEVILTDPGGGTRKIPGFWDGGRTWRFRFSPDQVGTWRFTTTCSDSDNSGLHGHSGAFLCSASSNATLFHRNGPIRITRDGRSFAHADGTPFFWLADTAWNGALKSTPEEWDQYIRRRTRQRFTAVQWVATQWRAAPDGDRLGQPAFTGNDPITLNPAFFQRLDQKIERLNRAGLLAVPVMLWAIQGDVNPGHSLPEDQAILLARYMLARWGAHHVVWFLGGDGDYRGNKADRWKRIGRAVFGDYPHAPATMHPGGQHWIWDEFKNEPWFDFLGYQSGHGDDANALRWIYSGLPATQWREPPIKPFLNLEPPYENHIAYQSRLRIAPHTLRRAVYWSLLNTPTAGVSYGGHGVWGWDDGTSPPTAHPNSGVPLAWQDALTMPGAEQMTHVARLFQSIDFHRLRPAPQLLASQPGETDPTRHLAASQSITRDLSVIYTPVNQVISLNSDQIPLQARASWFNPRTGIRASTDATVSGQSSNFLPPGDGDWVLLIQR
jgi:hypothetical protein